MHTARSIFTLVAALGCVATQSVAKKPQPHLWDVGASEELRAEVDRLARAVESGDPAAIDALLADGFVAYQPNLLSDAKVQQTKETPAAALSRLFPRATQAAEHGIRYGQIDCRATVDFGVCTSEYELAAPTHYVGSARWRLRTTATARRQPDGWTWTHLHTSHEDPANARIHARLLPDVAVDSAELVWQPVANGLGAEEAKLWSDAEMGDRAAFLRVPAGWRLPSHRHSHGVHIVLMKGKLVLERPSSEPRSLEAGGYAYTRAESVHALHAPEGGLLLIRTDGPYDFQAAPTEGKP